MQHDEELDADATAVAALHAAAAAGDVTELTRVLSSGTPAHAQEDVDGASALMLAAGGGHGAAVAKLVEAGAPWNAIDRRGRCAGNYALDAGHQEVVDQLVDVAVRAELLLGAALRAAHRPRAMGEGESEEYLSRGVRYDGDRLLDEADEIGRAHV